MIDVTGMLGEGGLFHRAIDGFVPRIAQQEMAREVADAINYQGQLVVESGTGTGKTYAYLVPAVLGDKRTIVSTGTKHLQEQVFYRDLPEVMRVTGVHKKSELLKGRANYLCRYRLRQNSQQSDLVGRENRFSYNIIDQWATVTGTGDIAEVKEINEDSAIWKQVTSTSENCLGARCPDYSRCFVNQARKRAMDADLVVVNHHLFFSDLTLKADGFGALLPEHDTVIFDEAHSLADIASKFFGIAVSSYQLRDLVADIVSAEKEEKSGAGLAQVCNELETWITRFLEYSGRNVKDPETLDALICDEFESAFSSISAVLSSLYAVLETAAPAGEGLGRCLDRCALIQLNIGEWVENRNSNAVSWLEPGRGYFRFHITPMNIGEKFSGYLQGSGKSWIFTSATLAVRDDFSGFFHKMGLQDAQAIRWDSPYNYQGNTLLYLPPEIPDPRDSSFPLALADTIKNVTRASRGRAFCLFTSHAMMERVYKLVAGELEWPSSKQGEAAKHHLLEKFLETENSVLFGTTSFWEGVDVQGESLSCVVIDKLPFEAPSDPVLKSQLKQCEERGGVPFMDIQLPDAVISLKQGAGRLIRSETDTGVLVICDSRIVTKSYGRLFLDSLPGMPVTANFADVEQFFR